MTDSKLLLKRSTLSAVQEFRLQSYYGVQSWKQASNHVLAVECLGLELTGEASNITYFTTLSLVKAMIILILDRSLS